MNIYQFINISKGRFILTLLAVCLIVPACKEKKADCAICTEKEIMHPMRNYYPHMFLN